MIFDLHIVFNSILSVLLGLALTIGAVVLAVHWWAWWPLTFIVLGILLIFRLEEDKQKAAFEEKFEAIKQQGLNAVASTDVFYGVFGEYLVRGTAQAEMLEIAERLHAGSHPSEPVAVPDAQAASSTSASIQYWLISGIEQIRFQSHNTDLAFQYQGISSICRFANEKQRKMVLSMLEPMANWSVDKTVRREFREDVAAMINFCAPLFFVGLILVIGGFGLLPLDQHQNIGGSGGGRKSILILASKLGQQQAGPSPLTVVLGLLFISASIILVRVTQYPNISFTTWKRPMTDAAA